MTNLNVYSKLIIAYLSVFLVLFTWWRAMVYTSENDLPYLLVIIGYLIPFIPVVIYLILETRADVTVRKNELSGGMKQ